MKVIQTNTEVERFVIYQGTLIFINLKKNVVSEKMGLHIANFFGTIYNFFDEKLIVQSFLGEFKLFDFENAVAEFKGFYQNQIKVKGAFFFTDESSNLYKLTNGNEVTMLPFKYDITYYNGSFFVEHEKKYNINFYNNDAKFISSLSLSIFGKWLDGAEEKSFEVDVFSGIYENTLVCNLNSGAVLLIDIHNPQNNILLPEARFPRKMYAKAGAPHIYSGLFGRRYIEVDVTTGQMVKDVSLEAQLRQIKNIPSEQPCWFSIGFSVLHDGFYYFICETNFIGVFNPQTCIIEDYHEFDFDKKQYQQLKGGEENLQVKDGKIYCLDSLGNLYELET